MNAFRIPVRYGHRVTARGKTQSHLCTVPVVRFASGGGATPEGSDAGPRSTRQFGPGGGGAPGPVDEIAAVLEHWLADVSSLLDRLQKALEQAHDLASGAEREELGALLASLRECRASVPEPQMIRAWLKSLTDRWDATKVQ